MQAGAPTDDEERSQGRCVFQKTPMTLRGLSASMWALAILPLLAGGVVIQGLVVHQDQLATARVAAARDSAQLVVSTWLRAREQLVEQLAADPGVREAAARLVATHDAAAAVHHPSQQVLRERLRSLIVDPALEGYFVVRLDGTSVASSRDQNIGTPNVLMAQPDVLQRAAGDATAVSRP